jgi:hypothetical protein
MNRQQKQKQQRHEQRLTAKQADLMATQGYKYAIEDAKKALSRLGWGETRLKRFEETLAKVQEDYGLIRRF